MSHYSVLVVTDFEPNKDNLAPILQPWHEFECTGIDDEYVRDIDITERLRTEYETKSVRRLRDANGLLHDPFDDAFFRDPTPEEIAAAGPFGFGGVGVNNGVVYISRDWNDGRGYRAKIAFVPDGMEEVDVPYCETMRFEEYCADYAERGAVRDGEEPDLTGPHKYGYAVIDAAGDIVRVIERTNAPQWKWTDAAGREIARTIGDALPPHVERAPSGRFFSCAEGLLAQSAGLRRDGGSSAHARDESGIEVSSGGAPGEVFRHLTAGKKWDWWVIGGRFAGRLMVKRGRRGRSGTRSWTNAEDPEIYGVDIARRGDLDFAAMRAARTHENLEWIREVGERGDLTFEEIEKGLAIVAEARIDERQKTLDPSIRGDSYYAWIEEVTGSPLAARVCRAFFDRPTLAPGQSLMDWARDVVPLTVWAVVKDGIWVERGKMGWFGMSSDELDEGDWHRRLWDMIEGLDDDTWITIVDCHI